MTIVKGKINLGRVENIGGNGCNFYINDEVRFHRDGAAE